MREIVSITSHVSITTYSLLNESNFVVIALNFVEFDEWFIWTWNFILRVCIVLFFEFNELRIWHLRVIIAKFHCDHIISFSFFMCAFATQHVIERLNFQLRAMCQFTLFRVCIICICFDVNERRCIWLHQFATFRTIIFVVAMFAIVVIETHVASCLRIRSHWLIRFRIVRVNNCFCICIRRFDVCFRCIRQCICEIRACVVVCIDVCIFACRHCDHIISCCFDCISIEYATRKSIRIDLHAIHSITFHIHALRTRCNVRRFVWRIQLCCKFRFDQTIHSTNQFQFACRNCESIHTFR